MNDIYDAALRSALMNAVKFGGSADVKAVMTRILTERPDLRQRAKEVKAIVEEVVAKVNSMKPEEQKQLLEERWPDALMPEKRHVEEKKGIETLPPLPGADKYQLIKLRFAPNPDFVLHLGSARPAIINYAYKVKYGDKARFVLRFEDTDPRTKRPMKEAYTAIKDDLKWLGIKWDEEYVQSQRMEVYYDHVRRAVSMGKAYVVAKGTQCDPDQWKSLKAQGKPCANREADPALNLELLDQMFQGVFGEGEAVVAIKTDLSSPDPSLRDWIALRIIDTHKSPHPLVGDKYILWPTYNFAVAIDDHLLGITHILRAQEHRVNTVKQSYVYKAFNWEMGETIHFGRLHIEGASLSKSILKKYDLPFNDITLPTLAGLRERGIQPEAIWEVILSVGIKENDATISMDNLFAANRRILEPRANRFMFVKDPVPLEIRTESPLKARIQYHPSHPERGFRTIELSPINGLVTVYVSRSDLSSMLPGSVIRLMDLANVKVLLENGQYRGEIQSLGVEDAKKHGYKIIQWVPPSSVPTRVIVPSGVGKRDAHEGQSEPAAASEIGVGDVVQLVRYGFVKLSSKTADGLEFIYIHG